MIKEMNIFMSSLFGDVVHALISMGFDKKDILSHTTIGTLSQLHRYEVDDIKRLVELEISEHKKREINKLKVGEKIRWTIKPKKL